MGVKGCGEVGTIGSPAAVTNAVVDALSHYGVSHIDMPTTPNRIWSVISERSATARTVGNVGNHPPSRIWASSQFRKPLPSTSVQGSSGESRLVS
jgi:hypothetical protein